MSKTLLELILLLLIASIPVIFSGCTKPAATGTLQIETVYEIFPSATEISKMSISRDVRISKRPGNYIISEIRNSSGLLGYCVESGLVSRSGPFKIRVFLDQKLVAKRAVVTSYPWERGRDIRRRSFTRQFEEKGPEDPIEIGKDIDAMTGATISSRAMSDGVREAIKLLKDIQKSQAAKRI